MLLGSIGIGCGSGGSSALDAGKADARHDSAVRHDASADVMVLHHVDSGRDASLDARRDAHADAKVVLDSSDAADGAACTGLQCSAHADNCAAQGKPLTSISGTVYDPAGALPLYNILVYIPNGTPDPIVPGGPSCTTCQAPSSGAPILSAFTDAQGHFTIQQGASDPWGVPSGASVPLVLQIGKWRRQVTVSVSPCEANALPDPTTPSEKLRLPAKSSEGDMPLMAFTSGCDPAECFLRAIGIDDSEFVAPSSAAGHVHFFTGNDANSVSAAGNASSVPEGGTPDDTYSWWSSSANLLKYDLIFNSCECNPNDRGAGAYQAMHDYLAGGGRLFATHYFYNWFAPPTGPVDFQGVVDWALPEMVAPPYSSYFIDTSFPKGKAYADWLQANGTTTVYGVVNVADTRWDMNAVTSEASRWIYNADSANASTYATMYTSFDTPIDAGPAQQCGRAVFSDVHVSGTSDDSVFPNECAGADPDGSHAINQRALEFLFFDLGSCIVNPALGSP